MTYIYTIRSKRSLIIQWQIETNKLPQGRFSGRTCWTSSKRPINNNLSLLASDQQKGNEASLRCIWNSAHSCYMGIFRSENCVFYLAPACNRCQSAGCSFRINIPNPILRIYVSFCHDFKHCYTCLKGDDIIGWPPTDIQTMVAYMPSHREGVRIVWIKSDAITDLPRTCSDKSMTASVQKVIVRIHDFI